MNIVVYTAIYGDIDRLWGTNTYGVPHFAYVDSPKTEYDIATRAPAKTPSWEQIVLPPGWDNRRSARHFKALPHYYLPKANIWVWLDGNVRLKISPQDLVEQFLKNDFATFKHPDRDCLYVEADFCAKAKKDDALTLNDQRGRYLLAGMPKNWGLAETRIVIRRNTPEICSINEDWWAEIENGSLRDQVSLPYVFWKHKATWDIIPGR